MKHLVVSVTSTLDGFMGIRQSFISNIHGVFEKKENAEKLKKTFEEKGNNDLYIIPLWEDGDIEGEL